MIQRRLIPRPKAVWTRAFPKQLKALRATSSLEKLARVGFKNSTPLKSSLKSRKPVKKISRKKAKSDRIYLKMSREWLAEGGGRLDAIAMALKQPAKKATCIHHKVGRLGTLKFDKRFWCPTTLQNSLWPHQNIEKARELNLIAKAGEWCNAPDDAETQRLKTWMMEKGIW